MLILLSLGIWDSSGEGWAQGARSLRFEVTAPTGVESSTMIGRLIIVTAPAAGRQTPEPRLRIGSVGADASPIAAVDVDQLVSGQTVIVDETSVAFSGRTSFRLATG